MRATAVLSLALLLAACKSDDDCCSPPPRFDAAVDTAGSSSQAGSPGGSMPPPAGTGGSAGTGGAPAPADAGAISSPDAAPPAAGGEALLIVGSLPLAGTDRQIQSELEAKGLKVQALVDGMTSAATAAGKRVLVISYSVESANVRGKFADVETPIIVMEHVLLPDLGMTTAAGHGWKLDVTDITIAPTDSPLAAGLTGDVPVFTLRTGEVFWGIPAPGAIKVATVKGTPNQSVIFAYPKGAMMVTRPAPGKRLQFFFGAHEHTTPMLNPAGLELLGAAIAWSID
jgi:hypothetical protein